MQLQEFFTHYPSRLLRVGVAVLGLFSVLFGASLLPILDQPNFPYPSRRVSEIQDAQPLPSLLSNDLQAHPLEFDISSVENRLILSLCPMRPDEMGAQALALLRIKGSHLTRQLPLPARLGLMFNDQGDLTFKDEDEQFWIEIELKEDGSLLSSIFVECGENVQRTAFSRQPTELPLQNVGELPCSEPFRVLSKIKWMGADLVNQLDGGRVEQKVEIASSKLNATVSEWVFWDGKHWTKAATFEEGRGKPLAKIHAASPQGLEWDAWNESGEFHVRFTTPLQNGGTPPIKIEEWFSSIRIRSDKKISCLLEKQCLVLREGDWILKENNRWRILRKPEERQHLIQGKRAGDLIILNTIDMKHKTIQGQFIFANRVQGCPIELKATSNKLERRASAPHSDRTARMGRLQ